VIVRFNHRVNLFLCGAFLIGLFFGCVALLDQDEDPQPPTTTAEPTTATSGLAPAIATYDIPMTFDGQPEAGTCTVTQERTGARKILGPLECHQTPTTTETP
jgi:hypothetical protein